VPNTGNTVTESIDWETQGRLKTQESGQQKESLDILNAPLMFHREFGPLTSPKPMPETHRKLHTATVRTGRGTITVHKDLNLEYKEYSLGDMTEMDCGKRP
jgi:hypothetical protein